MNPGTYVQLQGLKKTAYLNGRAGIITEPVNQAGRVTVNLLEQWQHQGETKHHPLALKPENVRLVGAGYSMTCTGTCGGCKSSFGSKVLSKCSGCRMFRYCSKACQKKHWQEEHKRDCKLLGSARGAAPGGAEDEQLPSSKQDRVFARNHRGLRYMQKGDLDAAEAEFRTIIDVEGCHMIGMYANLGGIILAKRKPEEAISYLRKAVTIPMQAPEDSYALQEAYRQLGDALHTTGDISGAKEAYMEVMKRDPGNAEVKLCLDRLGA